VVVALLAAVVLALLAFSALTVRREGVKPSIRVTAVRPEKPARYELVEVDLNVTAQFRNPFDPEDVNVTAVFRTPSGKTVAIPAFYYQEYRRELRGEQEVLTPTGEPFWKVRFTPTEAGEYRFRVVVRDSRGESASTEELSFTVVDSGKTGFVRLRPGSPYLEVEGRGAVFFVGHDVCWPSGRGTFDYDAWFEKMNASGENITRIWMAPWYFGIEWSRLGYYDMAQAWRLDYVVRLAERYGIYILLCLINHGQFSTQANPQWDDNPYNARKGGPLARPEDFWTNEKAIRLFKNRLRYIVARWGYSTNILAWELWNEVDLTDNYYNVRGSVASWHRDMAMYLKSIDPYGHLVTTSFANPTLDPLVWELEEMDFVTIHRYGPEGFKDIAGGVYDLVRNAWQRYSKPVIVSEFGCDWRWWGEPYYSRLREGVDLHNGIWASLMAGSASTAMLWWWDVYIDRFDLYYHFKALSRFIEGENLWGPNLRQVVWRLEAGEGSRNEYGSITIYPVLGWSRPGTNLFEIYENGTTSDLSQLSSFVHGRYHSELRNNPSIKASFKLGGRFTIHVNSVAQGGAVLLIKIDGGEVLRVPLPDKDGKNDGSANEYNTDFTVDVPPGEHVISIDNAGNDWFTWDYIVLEGSVIKQSRARVLGLTDGRTALLWIQNKDHNWWNVVNNATIEPVTNLDITVAGLEDGKYAATLWDTYSGDIIGGVEIEVKGGEFKLHIDELEKDIALKIVPFHP